MLHKQAKILSVAQERAVLAYLAQTQFPLRNKVAFLLSIKAGLRAKEIASLSWRMVTDSDGNVGDCIHLTNAAAKGHGGGIIPIAQVLKDALRALRIASPRPLRETPLLQSRFGKAMSAQAVVNMFWHWYSDLDLQGCSSHSGRRTFITRAARNISRVGGSMRDVQELARHRSLATTQKYIEVDSDAMRKVVDL